MKILLANDDGADSPLLECTIEALAGMGELWITVPKVEQSWRGKAITRWGSLSCERLEMGGQKAFVVNGTPADCVNLAVHRLLPAAPDLVVSGVNLGANTGVGFALCSGTLGACLEANIAGIPALAVSQHLPPAIFDRLCAGQKPDPRDLEVLISSVRSALAYVLDRLRHSPEVLGPVRTLSLNFPVLARRPYAARVCKLGRTVYGSCFEKAGHGAYEHRLEDVTLDTLPDCDEELLRQGWITVTPIDIFRFGEVPADTETELAKSFS